MGFNKVAGDQLPAAELNRFYASAGLYGASSVGSDSYAITVTPAPNDYDDGDCYTFRADVGNTGPATLNVNGLGAKALAKYHNQPLTTGDIAAGMFVRVIYDATNDVFQIGSIVLEDYQTSGGYWNFVAKLASDFVVTNDSNFQDVTDFSLPVVAGEKWLIEIMGSMSSNASTGDTKATLITTGTIGETQSWYEVRSFDGSSVFTAMGPVAMTTNTTLMPSRVVANGSSGDPPYTFYYRGLVAISGNGTIKFQIANNSASAGRTSSVKAGTYMLARKLS